MAAVVVLFAFGRGQRDLFDIVVAALAFTIPAGWYGSRTQIAAGAGWLSHRTLVRRRWVRTDQIVRVKETPLFMGVLLDLRDSDGRKLFVTSGDLGGDPRLLGQVRADLRTAMGRGLQLSDRARAGLQLDGAKKR